MWGNIMRRKHKQKRFNQSLSLDLVALAMIMGVNLWLWRPLIQAPAGRITNDHDGVLIAWIHAQVAENLSRLTLDNFWDGRIFYPNPLSVTFSDVYLPAVVITLPVWLTTREPVALLTASTLVAVGLTQIMLFFLLHELTNDRITSVICTLVFGFAPVYLHYTGHVHTLQLAGVVVALLALVKLRKKWSTGWYGLWLAAWVGQTTNNFLTGMMVIGSALVFVLADKKLRENLRSRWRWVVGGLIIGGGLMLPVIIPYLQAERYYHSARSLRDVMHFSLSVDGVWTQFGSPLLYCMGLFGWLAVWKNRRQLESLAAFGWLGLVSLLMALGPALKWAGQSVKIPHLFGGQALHIPLPYLIFYYLVPGFQGFRTPSRWFILTALMLTVGATVGISTITKPWRIMIWGILIGGLIFTYPMIATVPVPVQAQYPPVYQWLKDQPQGVVLELPIFTWGSDNFSKNEAWRMLYQTLHNKTLVNGYSGYSPPEWEKLVKRLQDDFPSDKTIQEIKDLGVTYLIIHEDEYERWLGSNHATKRLSESRKRLPAPIYSQGKTKVYGL